jgi:DNA polymerase-3 subunit gamma/tau
VSVTGDTVHLCLDARSEGMRTRQLEERLAQSLTRYVGRPMRVAFEVAEEAGDTPARQQQRERDTRLEQARAAIESDPTVRALQDRFAAVIQPDSIRPLG